MRDAIVTLSDGRRLAWRETGARTGFPVIALHGTPGARTKFDLAAEAASAAGVRIIAVDRWAYGGSDAPAAPSLRAFGRDMAELADRLGLPATGVLGISGGGPYAVATAASLGTRATGLALVAPVGVVAGCGGIGLFHRLCFSGLPRIPGAARLTFAAYRAVVARRPGLAVRIAAARGCPADREVLSDPVVRDGLARCFAAGLQPGSKGPAIDMILFARPWDIDLAGIATPARLWIGSRDGNVPVAAAYALARALGSCEAISLPNHGHYWFARHAGEPFEWLRGSADMRKAPPHGSASLGTL